MSYHKVLSDEEGEKNLSFLVRRLRDGAVSLSDLGDKAKAEKRTDINIGYLSTKLTQLTGLGFVKESQRPSGRSHISEWALTEDLGKKLAEALRTVEVWF